jgi:hypothetical protein
MKFKEKITDGSVQSKITTSVVGYVFIFIYLFIYGLFKYLVSSSNNIASDDRMAIA